MHIKRPQNVLVLGLAITENPKNGRQAWHRKKKKKRKANYVQEIAAMNNYGTLARKCLDLDFVSFYLSTEKKGGVRYVKSRGMTPETLAWEIKGHGEAAVTPMCYGIMGELWFKVYQNTVIFWSFGLLCLCGTLVTLYMV